MKIGINMYMYCLLYSCLFLISCYYTKLIDFLQVFEKYRLKIILHYIFKEILKSIYNFKYILFFR